MKPLIEYKTYLRYEKRVFRKIGSKHFSNKKVLDIGCGWGLNSNLIAQVAKSVVAVDIKERPSWKQLATRLLRFKVADALSLPFKDSSFDVVYARNLIHHVDNPKIALKEMKRVVKSNGKIIIAEANRYNPIFYIHMTKIWKHEHFTRTYFKKLINDIFIDPHFYYFEAQYYPTDIEIIHKIERLWEILVEKINFYHAFLSYNIAAIKNLK